MYIRQYRLDIRATSIVEYSIEDVLQGWPDRCQTPSPVLTNRAGRGHGQLAIGQLWNLLENHERHVPGLGSQVPF